MLGYRRVLAGCFAIAAVVGCTVHRIDIQQGNVITEEARNQLQLGMAREQVQFLLGTPLLIDPFHDDRWDYVYTFVREGEDPEEQRLSLIFQDDKLVRVIQDITAPPKSQPWAFPVND